MWEEDRDIGVVLPWAPEQDRWKSGSQVIKTLKSLQYLTVMPVFLSCDRDGIQKLAVESLEPLRDLRLKGGWEPKILGSQEVIKTLDAALKRAGFDCFVTRLEE